MSTPLFENLPLLRTLPELGGSTGKHLPDKLLPGFVKFHEERFCLIEDRGVGRENYFTPRRGVDFTKKNAAKRRLLTFDETRSSYQVTVNHELSGGSSYPVLTGLLSIGLGFATAGGSIAFDLVQIAAEVGRQVHPVLARVGDELWQVEQVGKTKGQVVHVEYFVLWDPYRRTANVPSDWIIHEKRRDVMI